MRFKFFIFAAVFLCANLDLMQARALATGGAFKASATELEKVIATAEKAGDFMAPYNIPVDGKTPLDILMNSIQTSFDVQTK